MQMVNNIVNVYHLVSKHITPLSLGEGLGERLFGLFFFLSLFFCLSSCSGESEDVNDINKQTVLVYMPWSGSASSSGLYDVFIQNLDSIESAIRRARTMNGRVLVFLSTSVDNSTLYEITYENGQTRHTTLNTYSGNFYTTPDGIARLLNDVKTEAFALNYAMVVGCHGSGWTYKEDWERYPYYGKDFKYGFGDDVFSGAKQDGVQHAKGLQGESQRIGGYPTTRFFGSTSNMDYATNVSTLAQGIAQAGMKMQYILFDDCYMANVETAYELKDVTNFVIASTSEVMNIGMPYQTMWSSLASATPSYATIVNDFKTFYGNYDYPYGTLSVIDCRALDELANRMRGINDMYTFPDSLVDSLQVLDGFHTPVFYDLGDYVAHLCKNNDMLNDFNAALSSAVKAFTYTDSIYSYLYKSDGPKYIKVNRFSGMTVSDPSRASVSQKGREKTAWWKATH